MNLWVVVPLICVAVILILYFDIKPLYTITLLIIVLVASNFVSAQYFRPGGIHIGRYDVSGSGVENGLYNDAIQTKLEKKLHESYEYFKTIELDRTVPDRLQRDRLVGNTTKGLLIPLVGYIIKDGTCTMDRDDGAMDDRATYTRELIADSLKWCKAHNLAVPDTTIYVFHSDRFPFTTEGWQNYPICLVARPKNMKSPIIPDITWRAMSTDKKYGDYMINWDQAKDKIVKYNPGERKEIIYFKGTDTTNRIHGLRGKLQDFATKRFIPMEVHLNAWARYEPVWMFKRYKMLLNLPGHYPWSNRLKYILLMDALVINVDVETRSYYPEWQDDYYETFTDYIVEPDVDYINIKYTYHKYNYLEAPPDVRDRVKALVAAEDRKLYRALEDIYHDYRTNPAKYKTMMERSKRTMQNITMERIYQYIYKLICLNAKVVDGRDPPG